MNLNIKTIPLDDFSSKFYESLDENTKQRLFPLGKVRVIQDENDINNSCQNLIEQHKEFSNMDINTLKVFMKISSPFNSYVYSPEYCLYVMENNPDAFDEFTEFDENI